MARKRKASVGRQAAIYHQQASTKNLKPPYQCPQCDKIKCVQVKLIDKPFYALYGIKKVLHQKYEVYCHYGCFSDKITLPLTFNTLDVYCKAVDELRHNLKSLSVRI